MEALMAAAGAIAGSIGSAAGLGWWLHGQFSKRSRESFALMAAHEEKDNARHLENLERFGRISVALARMGYKNGDGLTGRS